MKYLLFIFIIIFVVIICACFGYSQALIFPFEKYGYLSFFTSLIGGLFIGHTGGITIAYYDDIL